MSFDVIDTGYLVDRIGLLNRFPDAVYALANAASVLYTNSRVDNVVDQANFLSTLLCGDFGVMSVLFGIVPISYACGLTPQAQTHLSTPVSNRISWRLNRSSDPIINFSSSTPNVARNNTPSFFSTCK